MSPVSGQVQATNATSQVHDFPSDVDLASVVFPLPQQVNGKYLVPTDSSPDIAPVNEAGQLIKLFVDHSHRDLLKGTGGRLGIVESDTQRPYAGGVEFVESKRFLKDRVFVLHDKSDKAVAVTAVDGKSNYVNACIIYGAEPLQGETGDESCLKEDDQKFHPWFRVVDDFPSYTSIDYWDGVEFKPFLRAHPDKREDAVGLLIKSASGHHTLGHLVKVKRGDKHGWDVTVAPGVDVGMCLCITAAMEDLFGGGTKWDSIKSIFTKK